MSVLKKLRLLRDDNMLPVPVVNLSNSEDVDGTAASAQSSAFQGKLVRIVSTDNALRVVIGVDPTALSSSIYIPAYGELWLPITPGDKVAVLGGIANITVAGD